MIKVSKRNRDDEEFPASKRVHRVIPSTFHFEPPGNTGEALVVEERLYTQQEVKECIKRALQEQEMKLRSDYEKILQQKLHGESHTHTQTYNPLIDQKNQNNS